MKRNHPLTVGEVVFDLNHNCFGVITQLIDGYARIDMEGQASNPPIKPGWCEHENRTIMDFEIPECEMCWVTSDLDALYQVAWGVKDNRTGNVVCYEHQEFEDAYPYYSPYLEENLYEFETEFN